MFCEGHHAVGDLGLGEHSSRAYLSHTLDHEPRAFDHVLELFDDTFEVFDRGLSKFLRDAIKDAHWLTFCSIRLPVIAEGRTHRHA